MAFARIWAVVLRTFGGPGGLRGAGLPKKPRDGFLDQENASL